MNVRRFVLWFFFAVGIYNIGLGIIKYDFFWPSIGFGLVFAVIAAVLLRRDRGGTDG